MQFLACELLSLAGYMKLITGRETKLTGQEGLLPVREVGMHLRLKQGMQVEQHFKMERG